MNSFNKLVYHLHRFNWSQTLGKYISNKTSQQLIMIIIKKKSPQQSVFFTVQIGLLINQTHSS